MEERDAALLPLELSVLHEMAEAPSDEAVEGARGLGQCDRVGDRED
jgi:hypothetical protein